eukprot:Filipodium_phascolosomae@DN6910_c0_g1_i1.p1
MGHVPGELRPTTNQFLKHHSKNKQVVDLRTLKEVNSQKLSVTTPRPLMKPPVPPVHDQPIHNLVAPTNFIAYNKWKNITTQAQHPALATSSYIVCVLFVFVKV